MKLSEFLNFSDMSKAVDPDRPQKSVLDYLEYIVETNELIDDVAMSEKLFWANTVQLWSRIRL